MKNKNIYSILTIIFASLSVIGGGYTIIKKGVVSPGYGLIPILFCIFFMTIDKNNNLLKDFRQKHSDNEIYSISSSLILTIISFYLLVNPFIIIKMWHTVGLSILLIVTIFFTILAKKDKKKKLKKVKNDKK